MKNQQLMVFIGNQIYKFTISAKKWNTAGCISLLSSVFPFRQIVSPVEKLLRRPVGRKGWNPQIRIVIALPV